MKQRLLCLLLAIPHLHFVAGFQPQTSPLMTVDVSLPSKKTEPRNLRIPRPPPWTEHLMERSVQIRSSDQFSSRSHNMLPLQIYRATNTTQALSRRDHSKRIFEVHDTNNNNTLSRSSATLVQQFDSLSPTQQRQLQQKIQKEHSASSPLNRHEHLHILYRDDHICVCVKPGGILSVPGPRRNPSLAGLVWDVLQPWQIDSMDQMIVHRLDMDTSGILVYALSKQALSQLHDDFRQRRVRKEYQALLVGHVAPAEMELAMELERDPHHPPFMRI
ncbi:Ribosomal large subunit pseudouridine synthase A (Partial), partial [Seminavis robusta]|eukprot:Sro564_g167490.1 Ribosomal large subunit pseudouridine synthase A (273) ;mRNA; f:58742-59560